MPQPVIRDCDAAATPWSAASFCGGRSLPTVLFEHQTGGVDDGGFSIVVTEPDAWLVEKNRRFVERPSGRRVDDPVGWMRRRHRPTTLEDEIPFVGGIAGYLGFEFGWRLDNLAVDVPRARTPDLWIGAFLSAAIYDHANQRWTVAGRDEEAVGRLDDVLCEAAGKPRLGSGFGWRTDDGFDAEAYRRRVGQAVDAIGAGEFFEVNYTERIRGRWRGDDRVLYDRLRTAAPGDFGAMIDVPELTVASISPEQFLRVDQNGGVITRPIKGTRPRGETAARDRRLARQLMESQKDRAENVMIVDLMRNDLTRVCQPGSVEATKLCQLHSFESVHHLVSTVRGRLCEACDGLDAFLAAFPAGSITGAPKLRSMEWIASHEQTARGPYTGSAFYWSDHGTLDSNVLIRTAVCNGEDVEYGTGGAVVADSEPSREFEEAQWKARPFLELLEKR